jgi:hypothetical protein
MKSLSSSGAKDISGVGIVTLIEGGGKGLQQCA